jgi:Protein of unknown function (DUF3572)
MAAKVFEDNERAETIALKALAYLAGEDEVLNQFLGLTGMAVEDLKKSAGEASFLAGILDYFLQDEALLLAFAGASDQTPETIVRARQRLPGALND